MSALEIRYIDDLKEGMSASYSREVTQKDVEDFAEISGDVNPVHLDEEYAQGTMFKGRIAHGMLCASYISTVLGTKLPGPGAVYVSQNLSFTAPVRFGDVVVATATIEAIDLKRKRVHLNCVCQVGDQTVLAGKAELMVRARKKA